jgi:hypothetical protein
MPGKRELGCCTPPGLRPPTRAGTSARDDHTQHRAGGGSPSSPRFLHALLPAFDSLMSGACSGVAAGVFCRVRLKTVTWAVLTLVLSCSPR